MTSPAMPPSSPPSSQADASGELPGTNRALVPLLKLARSELNAQGAYLYSVDLGNALATLMVWSGLPPAAAGSIELRGGATQSRLWQSAPVVFRRHACKSAVFEELPEFRRNRFEGVVSIPLLESGRVIGRFNICRLEPLPLQPGEFSCLLKLSVPIAALMAPTARGTLEGEIETLTRQLADRKLLERAKGVIRSRFGWTEEQAYFCIRNLSRRRHTPMRRIAAEIIATSGSRLREDTPFEA
jgi:signal transduction protein with GAF and PtsI domain